MQLLLIAGHGAGDPGAVSGVFQEAVETRRGVGALVRLLKGYCDVTQYPPVRNTFSDFRTGQLNKQVPLPDFDFVLEIHFNASAAGPKDGKTKGVEIFVRKVAPLGDPIEVNLRGYELSLRKADAEMIEVS